MGNAGVGRLCDWAIAGLLRRDPIDPALYAYERRKRLADPEMSFSPKGSCNHGPASAACDLVGGIKAPGTPWRHPADWLARWYELNAERGQDAYELGSTVYGDTHAIVAMIAAERGVPGAQAHLNRAAALWQLHMTSNGPRMPGGRSAWERDVGLDQTARYLLGLPVARRPRPQRSLVLAQAIGAKTTPADPCTIRSAPGALVHRQHERGFVSFFESGPRCYSWPVAAVVAVDGQEPVWVRPPTSTKGKGAGEVRSVIEPTGHLFTQQDHGRWSRRIDLAPLGALVRETRIERAGGS